MLLLIFVTVTWIVNRNHKTHDTIATDLIAFLTFPAIAAADFMYNTPLRIMDMAAATGGLLVTVVL